MKNNLVCYFQNVNGIRNKLIELTKALATTSYQIIALVETNLKPEILDSELGFINHNIFRCDRSSLSSGKCSGGGVLIAVHNSLQSHRILSGYRNTESVFIRCTSSLPNTIIGCAYIPPNQAVSTYTNLCMAVDEAVGTDVGADNLLVLGDFNLPNVDWSDDSGDLGASSRQIMNMAALHDLKQFNLIRNYRGVILDLVFSSVSLTQVTHADDFLLPEDRHHPALDITLSLNLNPSRSDVRFVPDFRKCDVNRVFNQLQALSLPCINDQNEAEHQFSLFSQHLSSIIEQNTPLKKISAPHFPKWFSRRLIFLVIEKKAAHKRSKTTGSIYDRETFLRLRRECKLLAFDCYTSYIARVEESIPQDIKSFWSHVNNLKCNSSFPLKMTLDGSEAEDSPGICNLFAQHFSSVFSDAKVDVPSFDFGWSSAFSRITLVATDVQKKLEVLDHSKSAGPDEIHPSVLKFCAPILAVHLTILFNSLLDDGIFPSCLKSGFVVPIYKKGDRAAINNYRPIVIQSALAKVFEALVLEQLYHYLRPFIHDSQHGFLRGRSTITNLLLLQEFVMSSFDSSCQVDCIYLDFSKAFDRVHHKLLIAKLAGYGVGGKLLKWLESYLTDRTLFVKFNGSTSASLSVQSGVPQGSHLGPLLFILFINDVFECITVNFLLFADDMKVYTRVTSPSDHINLQTSLSRIAEWCKANAMELNTSKCQVISFSRTPLHLNVDYHIGDETLVRVDRLRDLGVVLTASLSPADHIASITSKAYSLLGFIARSTKGFRSHQSMLILYKSIVRPLLEYGTVIWSPYQLGHIEELNKIQSRFVRMLGVRLGFAYLDVPIQQLEQSFSLQSLRSRRSIFDLVLLYKLVSGLVDCPVLLASIDLCVPRGTRSLSVFSRRQRSTSYSCNSGVTRLLRLGSLMSGRVDFFHGSVASFRREIEGYVD